MFFVTIFSYKIKKQVHTIKRPNMVQHVVPAIEGPLKIDKSLFQYWFRDFPIKIYNFAVYNSLTI
jgi:hypothetical protein